MYEVTRAKEITVSVIQILGQFGAHLIKFSFKRIYFLAIIQNLLKGIVLSLQPAQEEMTRFFCLVVTVTVV